MHNAIKTARNRVVSAPAAQRIIRRSAAHLPDRLLWRLPPVGSHDLTAPDGTHFRYVADLDDQLARSLVWRGFGTWEATTVPLFYQLAAQARGLLDIGAYTGIYTLLACTANPSLRAVAFEPNPQMYAKLVRNLRANGLAGRVSAEPVAVLDVEGSVTLTIPADTTAATVVAETGEASPAATSQRIRVPAVRAQDRVPRDMPVDLVKVDVEGAELPALRGLARVLAEHQPSVFVECLGGTTFPDVQELLADFGYRHFYYLGPDGPVPTAGGFAKVVGFPNFLCRTTRLLSPAADAGSTARI